MKGFVRILRYTLYILMILAMVSCASSKKNSYSAKKKAVFTRKHIATGKKQILFFIRVSEKAQQKLQKK